MKLKKIQLFLLTILQLCFLFVPSFSKAQILPKLSDGISSTTIIGGAPDSTTVFTIRKQPLEKSILWKVTGNGLKKEIFLMATIHLQDKKNYTLPVKVKNSLMVSDILVTEVNLNDAFSPNLDLFEKMLLPDGLTLSKCLKEDSIHLKNYIFKATSKNFLIKEQLESMEILKPIMFQSLILSQELKLADGSEKKLLELARREKKKLEGLETTADQLAALNLLSLEAQTAELAYTLKNLDSIKIQLKQLFELYKKEDIEAIYNSSAGKQFFSDLNLEKVFLEERNKKWLQVLLKKNDSKRRFVAVGAAHLPGQNGLIELFKKEGFIVSPVF